MPMVGLAREEGRTSSQTRSNPKPEIEIMASVAMGHPFRFDDQGFVKGVNFAAGYGW